MWGSKGKLAQNKDQMGIFAYLFIYLFILPIYGFYVSHAHTKKKKKKTTVWFRCCIPKWFKLAKFGYIF